MPSAAAGRSEGRGSGPDGDVERPWFGSSAINRAGLAISAIAIITRWRMPPDMLCGNRRCAVAGEGTAPGRASRSRALSPRAATSRCEPGSPRRSAGRRCERLSEVIGSWKSIDILPPRSLRRSSAESRSTSDCRTARLGLDLARRARHQPHHRKRRHALATAGLETRPIVRPRGTLK